MREGDNVAKGDKLSEKEERFCLNYIENAGNGTRAYKDAGYAVTNDDSAKACASRLLTNANIQKRLEELRAPKKEAKILSIDERRQLLTRIALDDDTRPNDKIKAMDILNRMDSLYIQRQDVNMSTGVVVLHDDIPAED